MTWIRTRVTAARLGWLIIAVVLVACTGGAEVPAAQPPAAEATAPPVDDDASEPAVTGGTVRVGVGDGTGRPPGGPNDDPVRLLTPAVLAPLWQVVPDGRQEPWLLAGEPEVDIGPGGAPLEVTYELRDDAVWSDGQPIDGRDVIFTIRTCQRLDPSRRPGQPCDAVDLTRSRADGRRVTVTFATPRSDWRALLAAAPVLPEHVLGTADPGDRWVRDLDVSSGPYRIASWHAGEPLILVRNDRWWGVRPTVERLEVRAGAAVSGEDVVDGTFDVVAAEAVLGAVERARGDEASRVAIAPGPASKVIDFNVASPRVARPAVRRVLAAAINRSVMVDELIAPVAPAAGPRDALITVGDDVIGTQGSASEPAETLADAGCAPGEDGLLVCDGQRMVLRLVAGDMHWQTPVVAEYAAADLERIGVDVVRPRTATSEADLEANGGWDLRVTTIDHALDATDGGGRWRCDDVRNDQAYCNTDLDAVLDGAASTLADDERAALLDDAEAILARDRPTLPLYAVPTMIVHAAGLRGPALNDGPWTVLWNAEVWRRLTNDADRT